MGRGHDGPFLLARPRLLAPPGGQAEQPPHTQLAWAVVVPAAEFAGLVRLATPGDSGGHHAKGFQRDGG